MSDLKKDQNSYYNLNKPFCKCCNAFHYALEKCVSKLIGPMGIGPIDKRKIENCYLETDWQKMIFGDLKYMHISDKGIRPLTDREIADINDSRNGMKEYCRGYDDGFKKALEQASTHIIDRGDKWPAANIGKTDCTVKQVKNILQDECYALANQISCIKKT